MSVRIAILGASGAVGSTLAAQLLRDRLLEPNDQLVLVGHGTSSAENRLLATKVDMLDAFDDHRVHIDVATDVTDFEADIVVVAAGATASAEIATRRDLAKANLPVFRRIAEECAARLPHALFIIVSNPVELAVQILAEMTDRHRVIGMGAQQDSLRFARAIAHDLGISRHHVRASVLGEHGLAMVPLWESVELLTRDIVYEDRLAALRLKALAARLADRVSTLTEEVDQLLVRGRFAAAYRAASRALPDARILVEPLVTMRSMRSTPNATANATLQLIAAALAVDGRKLHGQVRLAGEALGIHGVCGMPVMLDHNVWRLRDLTCLNGGDRDAVIESAASIGSFLGKLGVAGAQTNRALDIELVS